MPGLFSVPIASIFARELLEASIIVAQYRKLVQCSDEWEESSKAAALKKIWYCAGGATLLAVLVIIVVAIPLAVAGNKLDKTAAEVIEGISKVVAAFCILMLSVKVPKWLQLGPYGRRVSSKTLGNTDRELCFNVSWNIWREVAEIGIFLIPSFLKGDLEPFPISAIVGAIIGLGLGALFYVTLHYTKQKAALAFIMAGFTGWLACGLFTGGMHEFEEVLGETADVFHFPGCKSSKKPSCSFWHHKKFPMGLVKPFGYSSSPSVLQMVSFWCFFVLLVLVHVVQYQLAVRKANKDAAGDESGQGQDSERV
jgi:high-affinity iron transporter